MLLALLMIWTRLEMYDKKHKLLILLPPSNYSAGFEFIAFDAF